MFSKCIGVEKRGAVRFTHLYSLRDPEALGVILVWSCMLLLPFARLVEVPVLLMALLGVALLVKHWPVWRDEPRVKLFVCVFAVNWIPILLSWPDAVNPLKTGEVVLNHLRFLFSGLFIIKALSSDRSWRLFTRLFGLLVAFWAVDAVVQYFAGADLFGIKAFPGRLSAMFGPDNSKFGLTLAVFVPVLWEYARRHAGAVALIVVVFFSVTVVVLTAQRSAWILVAAALGCYGILLSLWIKVLPRRALIVTFLAAVVYASLSYFVSDEIQRGVDRSVAAVTGKDKSQTNSIIHRYWILKGAWSMMKNNPLNGVGARGFRHAFEEYADPDDPFMRQDPPAIPTHSHQLLTEIGAESGFLGLLGLTLMGVLLIRAATSASYRDRDRILPYAVCLAAAYFPFNTHLAIYSAYWSQILWYLIALYCAAAFSSTDSTAAISSRRTRATEK